MQNKFFKQSGDVYHATTAREFFRDLWLEIEGPHRHSARHGNCVRDLCWDPHSKIWRYNPSAVRSAHGHHSTGGIHELISIMEMQWYDVPGGVVVNQRGDRGRTITRAIKNSLLALLKH